MAMVAQSNRSYLRREARAPTRSLGLDAGTHTPQSARLFFEYATHLHNIVALAGRPWLTVLLEATPSLFLHIGGEVMKVSGFSSAATSGLDDHSACPTTELAHSTIGRVEVCRCGLVTVHIGPVTLRLTSGALSEVNHLLASAVTRGGMLQANDDREPSKQNTTYTVC
jgi:hypothetical protein